MSDNKEEQRTPPISSGPDQQVRWRPDKNEIQQMLAAHRTWLESRGREGSRLELYFADLNNADLHLANLRGACLWETTLSRADLRDADLTETEGILPKSLAGANLSGAKVDDDLKKFRALNTVEKASRYARKIFFLLLIIMVYTWLTLASVSDATLLSNLDALRLPFAGVTIPATIFFGAVPIILLLLFLYFHLVQQRVWEAISDLPAVFPDGTDLQKNIYPWLLNGIASAHVKYIRKNRPVFSRFQNAISIIVAWWLVPYTMVWFWIRYLTKREWVISGILIASVSLAIGFAFFFLFLARRTLRGESLRGRGIILRVALFIVLVAFFGGASYGIIEHEPGLEKDRPLSFVMDIAEVLGYETSANFSNTDVSIKPSGWTGAEDQIDQVRGAELAEMNLPNARAVKAFLVKADLRQADLTHALLDSADLRYADLSSADLRGASLAYANLEHANMSGTDLTGADLRGANLTDVRGLAPGALYSANNWLQAKFGGDILDSLGLPPDHNERIARRDLSGADLHGANLENVSLAGFNLSGTDLEGANLSGAILDSANLFLTDLRGAKGIRLDQIRKTRNWLFAMYDNDLIKTLQLPENHNELASERDFRTYDLRGINLAGVDLKGANLRKVDLTGAVLRNVNLQDADLYAVKMNNADMSGADFRGTILLDTDLRGANLTGVKNLTIDQLRWAVLDTATVFPDYLREQAEELLSHRSKP